MEFSGGKIQRVAIIVQNLNPFPRAVTAALSWCLLIVLETR